MEDSGRSDVIDYEVMDDAIVASGSVSGLGSSDTDSDSDNTTPARITGFNLFDKALLKVKTGSSSLSVNPLYVYGGLALGVF
jgi:hypothetical protein